MITSDTNKAPLQRALQFLIFLFPLLTEVWDKRQQPRVAPAVAAAEFPVSAS